MLKYSILQERKVGRKIYSAFTKRLGFGPSVSRYLTKCLIVLLHPYQFLIRRFYALFSLSTMPFNIPDDKGYVSFKNTDLPWGKEALEICDKIVAEAGSFKTLKESNLGAKGKAWRANLLKPEHLANHPELLQFATSPEIISVVSKYLKTVPVLGDIQLWWTITNNEEEASQQFHIDQEDYRQVKVFLHIRDVQENSGPITFLPADESKKILPKLSTPYSRSADDEFYRYISPEKVVKFVAPRGECVMLDTSRCYHQGSRTKIGERHVLVFYYLPFTCVAEPNRDVLTEEMGKTLGLTLSPIGRLVL